MRRTRYALAAVLAVGAFFLFLTSNANAASEDALIEEVIVTGSYIKRKNQADMSSPLNIIGLEDMKANGWTDLEDVAETFTFSPSNFGRSGLRNGCCGGARAIELRGLGVSSTLVLLNGKRTASISTGPAGADFTNIKELVPMIAIDRIETLLDGGAALYGSDAVAGVVNMITRTDFEGFEIRVGGKDIDGSGQVEAQFIVGGGNDRVHGIFAFAYEHQDHMANRERDFNLINNTSGTGSPGTYFTSSRPVAPGGGDVIIDNGVHGPINYSVLFDQSVAGTGPFDPLNGGPGASPVGGLSFADPYCLPDIVPGFGNPNAPIVERGTNVPGGGQFSGAAGTFPWGGVCRSSYQPNNSVVPQENNYSVYTHWELEVNEFNTLSIEASYVRSQGWTEFIATFPQTNGKPIVPGTNPANPFGVDLTWTGRSMGLAYDPKRTDGDGTSTRLAATWEGDFAQFINADWAESWTFTLSAQYSDDRGIGENPDTDLRRIQDALNGFGGQNCEIRFDGPSVTETAGVGNCSYYSPFALNIYNTLGDPSSGFAAVMDANGTPLSSGEVLQVLGYNAQTESSDSNERSLEVFEAIFTGDIFDLPGGNAGLAFGYQQRHEIRERQVPNFQNNFSQGFLTPRTGGKGGRTVDAFFVELYLPVLENVDIQIAVRNEDYGDIDSTDPKFGINWRITDTISVRASAGSSFRAPSLGNVVGNDAVSTVAQVLDPVNPAEAGGAGTFRTLIFSKNPNLEPEESDNFNIGISWKPELPWGDGSHWFQIDLDYFDFEFENQIRADDAAQIVAADPCGPQVVRDPVNIIVGPLPPPAGATPCPAVVGQLLLVNLGFFNSGKTETAGFDLSMVYGFDWLGSSFTIRSETTFLDTYEVQVSDGGPIIEGVGFSNDGNPGVAAPEIKSNLMVNWLRDAYSANLTVRYVDEVEDDAFGLRSGNKGLFGVIDSHTEVDVQFAYEFGPQREYSLAVGAINVFDKEPPDTFFRGYSEELHNPFMRQLYVRAGASF